jgi:hypothetical protein
MVWSEQRSHDRLRLLDLGTRELTAIGGLGDRHVVEVVQRPDGGPLAVISWDRPEDEPGAFTARLHVVDPETGHVRDLGPLELDAHSPAWWRAGGRWQLAYLAVTPPGPVGGTAVFDAGRRWPCSPTGWTPRFISWIPGPSGSAAWSAGPAWSRC